MTMKSEKFSGTVASAYGKQLDTELKFSGEYEAFENLAEADAAKEGLTNDEQLAVINNKRKASARAVATTNALKAAGIEKPDPNSPEVLTENMIVSYMKKTGNDRATAEQIIKTLLS